MGEKVLMKEYTGTENGKTSTFVEFRDFLQAILFSVKLDIRTKGEIIAKILEQENGPVVVVIEGDHKELVGDMFKEIVDFMREEVQGRDCGTCPACIAKKAMMDPPPKYEA